MDAYVALLENTQSAGLIYGVYKFLDVLLTLNNEKLDSMAAFASGKVFDDELGYYTTSVYVFDFYSDVCENSVAIQCTALYYYWMF